MGGFVLLWSWYEDRTELILAWGGVGYLLCAIGAATFAARGSRFGVLRPDHGATLVILGLSCTWAGARAFKRRNTPLAVLGLGTLILLALTCLPIQSEDVRVRAACAFAIIACYMLLNAVEILRARPYAAARRSGFCSAFTPSRCRARSALAGVHSTRNPAAAHAVARLDHPGGHGLQPDLRRADDLADQGAAGGAAAADGRNRPAHRPVQSARLLRAGGAALEACARLGRPSAVLIFDLDEFKEVNDTFGHPAGDAVLKAFGAAAVSCVENGDIVGRIGGEEFALVLPGKDQSAASAVAHQIMARFKHLAPRWKATPSPCTARRIGRDRRQRLGFPGGPSGRRRCGAL